MNSKIKRVKLTEDYVFKHFLYHNKEIISLLIKCFVPIDKDTSNLKILSLSIEETLIAAIKRREKQIKLDMRVQLKSGEHINIERFCTR